MKNPLHQVWLAMVRFRLRRKWKVKARLRKRVSIRVASPIEFLKDLEAHGLAACVLRWPDEVPEVKITGKQDKKHVDATHGDVDVLIALRKLDDLLPVVVKHQHPQGVRCDVYSVAGLKGTQFMRYPYYPPLRAMLLISGRQQHRLGFHCLVGRDYICSLVYHLVYHKGLASGIPMTAGDAAAGSEDSYLRRLQNEAKREGVALPSPVTLENLERWLCENHWQMPYDLLVRWPVQDNWIHHLQAEKTRALSLHKVPEYEFVYLLREDIENSPLEELAEEMLGKKFEIIRSALVPPDVRKAMALWLRGGSWGEGKGRKLILPYKCILCVDHDRQESAYVDARFPHVDNKNFFYKHEVRDALRARAGRKICGIHGSDNAAEAGYMKSIWHQFLDDTKSDRLV